MIPLGCRAATTLLAATGERIRKQEQYRKRRRTCKYNQRETAYVRRQEKGRASIINRKRQRQEGRVGNIAETKERRSRLASGLQVGEISLPARYGGDRWRRLMAEDDRGCGSGNEDEPQGDKGESGTGAGTKEPVAPG